MAQRHPPIKGFTTKYTTTRSTPMALALCALCLSGGCVPHRADAQAAAVNTPQNVVEAITEISIERDCSGCATGTVFVLRRDGTALLQVTGKARLGTQSTASLGSVSREDFDALARLALSLDFFKLNDSYEDPQLRDGAWSTLRVMRGAQDKRVFRRDEAGPAALRDFEAALDQLKARTRFVAAPR
jgi:hypothetical protein